MEIRRTDCCRGCFTSSSPFVDPLSMVDVRSNNSKKVRAADNESPIRRALQQRQIKRITRRTMSQPTVMQHFSLIVLQILQMK